ncbi:MAG: hypothetical protein ABJG88_10175 [Litorimonas sp.]
MSTENETIKDSKPVQGAARGKSTRRPSRYNRVQERRAAQKRADSRFYAGMFSIMGVVAMFAILLSAISINGANVDVSAMESWARPWLGPFTKLEVAGLAFVCIVAAIAYARMRRK